MSRPVSKVGLRIEHHIDGQIKLIEMLGDENSRHQNLVRAYHALARRNAEDCHIPYDSERVAHELRWVVLGFHPSRSEGDLHDRPRSGGRAAQRSDSSRRSHPQSVI